ncbi:hypothetical protein [Phycicoccus sp. SLBN-51]|uniref:hypothetical protein n=1 Tax=Phycicoccus sp. SLBN-51 TaxID=2768447 RepID=UPI00114DA19D|nr:hypothetical protein [Phycicoccus sp. SLBN-51]
MKLWKVLGIAGLAGVAATGAIMARDQRRRAQPGPQEIRSRLQQRLEQAEAAQHADAAQQAQDGGGPGASSGAGQ